MMPGELLPHSSVPRASPFINPMSDTLVLSHIPGRLKRFFRAVIIRTLYLFFYVKKYFPNEKKKIFALKTVYGVKYADYY